jgi:hypothetical protein
MAGLRHVMVVMGYVELTRATSAAALSRVLMHTHNAWVRTGERTPHCPRYDPSVFLQL